MKIEQSFGVLELKLWIGEALEMVNSLEKPCDVWFLDGHSPKKNPSIWRRELLMAIGEKTKTGGGCSTFTVAVDVQKSLMAAGFTIKKLPGCGEKKGSSARSQVLMCDIKGALNEFLSQVQNYTKRLMVI